jgi:hypothetical protein
MPTPYSKMTLQQKIAKQAYHTRWRALRNKPFVSIFDMETPPPIRAYNRKNKFVSLPEIAEAITEKEDQDQDQYEDNISVMTEDTEATSNEFISTPFKKREELLELEFECLSKMRNIGITTQEQATIFINNINQADLKRSLKPFQMRTPTNVIDFLQNMLTYL